MTQELPSSFPNRHSAFPELSTSPAEKIHRTAEFPSPNDPLLPHSHVLKNNEQQSLLGFTAASSRMSALRSVVVPWRIFSSRTMFLAKKIGNHIPKANALIHFLKLIEV